MKTLNNFRIRRGDAPAPVPIKGTEMPTTYVVALGVITLAILMAGAIHLFQVFHAEVKGDEFRFLADIYRLRAGTLTKPFFTLHVRLFDWLPVTGLGEIDQIIFARLAYFVLLVATCWIIFIIGRAFFDSVSAAFSVLCYLCFEHVLLTATSFRFDGLSVFFVLAALAMLIRGRSMTSTAWAGATYAFGLLVTLKAVFYLPTLVALALLRDNEGGPWKRLTSVAILTVAVATTFAIITGLHSIGLGENPIAAHGVGLVSTGTEAVTVRQIFPNRAQLVAALVFNIGIWLFLFLGTAILALKLARRHQVRRSLMLLALLLPLGSLAIYRNTFAYYYTFIMPAPMIVVGAGVRAIFETAGSRAALRLRVTAATAIILLTGVQNAVWALTHESVKGGTLLDAQKQTLAGIHQIFPEPVPYIDARSMVPSFPKAGFFMSDWGFEGYRLRGVPIFGEILRNLAPPFLFVNSVDLWPYGDARKKPVANQLLPEDLAILRENYIHHWGPVLVAGKCIVTTPDEPTPFEILIPGVYTVESKTAVVIDGDTVMAGEATHLKAGWREAWSMDSTQAVVLRWGARLFRPSIPATWSPDIPDPPACTLGEGSKYLSSSIEVKGVGS